MVRIRRQLEHLTVIVALLGLAPVFLYLDRPVQAIIAVALPLGVWSDRRHRYLLSAPLATVLSILVFVVYLLQIDQQNLVLPALNIGVLLLAVRLLTEKQGRHFLQIFLLSGFALAGSTLVTLHLSFLPLMVLEVCGVIFGLVLLCYDADDPQMQLARGDYRILLRTTLLLPLGTLLLATLFFFILPRTQYPLWDFLNPGNLSGVGFSEEVSPGSVSGTVADQRIAFRAESDERAPEDLYWRVTVLDQLEGTTWKRTKQAPAGAMRPVGGRVATVNIFPESGQRPFLVTLDTPMQLTGLRITPFADSVYAPRRPTKRALGYEVVALVGGRLPLAATEDVDIYLALPAGLAPRARALLHQRLSPTAGRDARVELAKQLLREQELVYATRDLPTAGDPVDTFLFDSKRGYCEHFASAFGVLLRAAGVPSRLVGGYYGGDYNPIGGYYAVGERAAHVWVEYLDSENRWRRYDPNLLAVRMESGLLATLGQQPAGWRQLMDAADYYWTQAVITLDFFRQMEVARDLYLKARQAGTPFGLLRIAVPPGLLLLALLVWRKRRRRPRQRYSRLLRRFLQRVGAADDAAGRSGLQTLAERSGSAAARRFAAIYGAALYRDRALTSGEVAELKRLLKEIGQD